MMENAQSGHTATAELFEQAISIDVRLEEALSHFGLTTAHFVPDEQQLLHQSLHMLMRMC